eukprot:scaffold132498_cov28-Tisochrysis_lutea.AAC.5
MVEHAHHRLSVARNPCECELLRQHVDVAPIILCGARFTSPYIAALCAVERLGAVPPFLVRFAVAQDDATPTGAKGKPLHQGEQGAYGDVKNEVERHQRGDEPKNGPA